MSLTDDDTPFKDVLAHNINMLMLKNCTWNNTVLSGDGTIDEAEFKSLCLSYGLSAESSVEAYNKFTSVSIS
jgi:hypothetical protein